MENSSVESSEYSDYEEGEDYLDEEVEESFEELFLTWKYSLQKVAKTLTIDHTLLHEIFR